MSSTPLRSFSLDLECPRCHQRLGHGQLRRQQHVVAARRWWQVSHTATELSCAFCRVRLRAVGVARALAMVLLAVAPWVAFDVSFSLQGVRKLAFLLSLVIPAWLSWRVLKASIRLELLDPRERMASHWVVKPGPAPTPELPPHLDWLRVIAPDLLPLYQRLTAVLLYGVGLPLLLISLAALVIPLLPPQSPVAFTTVGLVLLGLATLFAAGSALPVAFAAVFVFHLAIGRAGPHLRPWWKLRSALFVLACGVPALLFAWGVADLIPLALSALQRGAA